MERDMTWGGKHTIHYTDDVLQNRTPETYVILLTNVTPINSIQIEKEIVCIPTLPVQDATYYSLNC